MFAGQVDYSSVCFLYLQERELLGHLPAPLITALPLKLGGTLASRTHLLLQVFPMVQPSTTLEAPPSPWGFMTTATATRRTWEV